MEWEKRRAVDRAAEVLWRGGRAVDGVVGGDALPNIIRITIKK